MTLYGFLRLVPAVLIVFLGWGLGTFGLIVKDFIVLYFAFIKGVEIGGGLHRVDGRNELLGVFDLAGSDGAHEETKQLAEVAQAVLEVRDPGAECLLAASSELEGSTVLVVLSAILEGMLKPASAHVRWAVGVAAAVGVAGATCQIAWARGKVVAGSKLERSGSAGRTRTFQQGFWVFRKGCESQLVVEKTAHNQSNERPFHLAHRIRKMEF